LIFALKFFDLKKFHNLVYKFLFVLEKKVNKQILKTYFKKRNFISKIAVISPINQYIVNVQTLSRTRPFHLQIVHPFHAHPKGSTKYHKDSLIEKKGNEMLDK
jgi:hypothetical protein